MVELLNDNSAFVSFFGNFYTVFHSGLINVQSHQQCTRVSLPAFAVLVFLVLDLLRVVRCSVSVTSHIWLTTFKLLGSTPVLLPGKSHGWRSLAGCSPWGLEESDTTERLHFHFSLSCTGEGNGNPLQCSCLENPRDRGAWWAAVYGVTQSRTQLEQLSSSSNSMGYISENEVAQSCPTLRDPTDCSPPGSSVLGIFQARVLEWVTIAFLE